MIGQTNFKKSVVEMVENNSFPRFSIIVGQPGSGKKLMSQYIAKQLNIRSAFIGTSVDEIRTMITEAYRLAMPLVYIIADADKMSPAAKNALLKVTEEPPRQAYFILTLSDLTSTLATIRSRGTVLYMNPYAPTEIGEYFQTKYHDGTYSGATTQDHILIQVLCETPGEVDTLVSMGVQEFYDYVIKVVDNIASVSGSNSFKIAQRIKFKDTDEDKYDLRLFWKAFMTVCSDRLRDDPLRYAAGIKCTTKYLQELRITGINKQSTFDMWLLDVRKEWMV